MMIRTTRTLALLAASALSAPAFATDAAPPTVASAPDAAQENVPGTDIVVTATRRETRLQQTPVAVTAISQDTTSAQHLTSARDLAGIAPGVLITQSGITPLTQTFFIRGIGDSDPIFDPSVAVYVDDAYLPRAINGMTDLTDIERIEVLRGPQGTLFGENAAAGAIRYVTRNPDDKTVAKADIGYGNYNTVQGHAYLAGALVPGKLAASIAIAHDEHEGYTWDPTINRRVNDQKTTGGRIKLVWTPSSDWKAVLSVDGTIDRSATAYYTPVDPIIGGTLAHPVYGAYQPNVSYASQEPLDHSWSGGAQFKVSHDVDSHLTINAITAWRAFGQDPVNYNNDGQPLVPYSAAQPQLVSISNNVIVYKEHELTQELQAQGKYGAIDFTAGFFALYENFSTDRIGYVVSPTAASPVPANPEDQIGDTRTTNYAWYAQGNARLTDKLILTLGGRYTIETRHFNFAGIYDDFNGQPLATPSPLDFTYYGNKTWRSFTPKAGLSYQATPDAFLYVSYAKGFDAGGFNNRAANLQSALPYNQEDVQALEGGIKSEWLNHRLRFNLTGFYNWFDNLQETASVISPVNGGFVSVRSNAGKAHTTGFELESSARPFDNLTLNANASYLSTRFDDFANAATAVLGGQTVLVGATGNALPFSPHWQIRGAINWRVPVDLHGELRIGADINHQTSYYSDVFNYAQGRVGGQDFINANVVYAPTGSPVTFALSARNLTNRIWFQSLTWGGTPSLYQGPQNPPRTVFFKVAWVL